MGTRRMGAGLWVVLLAGLAVGCGNDDGETPDGGGSSDPCANRADVCLDLDPWISTEGSGALARQADEADLIGGEAAQGRAGDWLLANDRIHLLVQGPDRHIGPAPYGGNVVDADVLRDGPGRDAFGEASLFLNLGRTLQVTDVEVLADGSDGGTAVLAVTGRDTLNDFINVPVLFGESTPLWLDPEAPMEATITQYFLLSPGETRVRMVAAIRNDAEGPLVMGAGELIDRGGEVDLFNPERTTRPFGAVNGELEVVRGWLGLVGQDVAYGYVPVGVPGMEGAPSLSLTDSGVTGLVVGADNFVALVGTQTPDPLPSGFVRLAPGEVHVVVRDLYVGHDLGEVAAAIAQDGGAETGTVSGTVSAPAAQPLPARTRVRASAANRTVAIYQVDGAGTFEATLPAGTYAFSVDAPGHPFSEEVTVEVAAGATAQASIEVPAAAEVTVRATRADGGPTPAKVTFVCADTCPKSLFTTGARFRDTRADPLPANVQHVGFLGVSGEDTFRVPPGRYHLVVSRGAEWSVYPAGWPATPLTLDLAAGDAQTVEAELARVLDTTGWISADLHVHGINSPDSTVPLQDRVLSFLAEGVEVLVATDHDVVTDYGPVVTSLGADAELATVSGQEITTFSWGHFNAFPLEVEAGDITGGALDWAGGEGPSLTPGALFEAAHTHPGPATKVVQVNHPRGDLGHFTAIGLDTATGQTLTDPADLRMSEEGLGVERDGSGAIVDSHLFSPAFTAMEIQNGFREASFEERANDWFAFLQRGLVVTATAVSDTHRRYSDAVGSPRSWVAVGDTAETPGTWQPEPFVEAINGMHLVGSNGPFLRVTARAGETSAGVGEVLSVAAGTEVTLEVSVEVPTWFGIDRIDLFANTSGTDARPFQSMPALPDPTERIVVDLSTETPVAGPGLPADSPHQRYVVTRSFSVQPEVDHWYVVLARGTTSGFPVLLEEAVGALAFANPIFVDVDGNGQFDAPEQFGPATAQAATATRAPLLDLQSLETLQSGGAIDLGHTH